MIRVILQRALSVRLDEPANDEGTDGMPTSPTEGL